jgi:hypothetical protein
VSRVNTALRAPISEFPRRRRRPNHGAARPLSRPEFRGDPEARMLSWWEGSLLHDACPEEVRR